jgi:PAS domain S-box-containing protein
MIQMDNMQNQNQNIILESIREGVFTVNQEWCITSFNKAAENITGVSREHAIGMYCKDILKADVCESKCTLRETMETGKPIMNKAVQIIDAKGNKKTISISTALLKNSNGEVIGGVETFRDTSALEQLRKEISGSYSYEDILSRNHKMQDIFSILPNIAESNTTVLIEGQSGTGKELFARAIHNLSFRKDKPFIAVNCGALPDALLESELFGYKAGAFTDAKKDKPGRFDLAQGGTIFLDEIGDMSTSVQVKLLRVLQEKTYEPVGGVSTVKADVRIITATNKNLDLLVSEGKFRDDLYYRINVMKLDLPPLRERKEDVSLLIEHFISKFNRFQNKNISCATNEVTAILLAYDYPGNIRELENIIEHAFVLCDGEVIEVKHLPSSVRPKLNSNTALDSEFVTIKQMEIALIRQALIRNKGNKTATAKQLGIDKSTLFRKIKAFDISDLT